MPTRKNQRKGKPMVKKSQRKMGKMQKKGKSKSVKGKKSSRVKKTRRRRGQCGSGWEGKRLDELREAAKKATASISMDISDPIDQDNELFDITNIPESIERFNAYLALKKYGGRYRLEAVEITRCHKKLRGFYTAPVCINLKFRTKIGPYISEMDRQIGPLNDFKDGNSLNLPFIVLFNTMQIRPDGYDATTVEKQFQDGVPEHQILQSSFIIDHKFPREPVDARKFLAQKEDDLETLKQRADTDRAREETRERAETTSGRTQKKSRERRNRKTTSTICRNYKLKLKLTEKPRQKRKLQPRQKRKPKPRHKHKRMLSKKQNLERLHRMLDALPSVNTNKLL